MAQLVHITGSIDGDEVAQEIYSWEEPGMASLPVSEQGGLRGFQPGSDLYEYTCSEGIRRGPAMPALPPGLETASITQNEQQFRYRVGYRSDETRHAFIVQLDTGEVSQVDLASPIIMLLRWYSDGSHVGLDADRNLVAYRPATGVHRLDVQRFTRETLNCTAASEFVGAFCADMGTRRGIAVSFECSEGICVEEFAMVAPDPGRVYAVLRSNPRGFNYVDQRSLHLIELRSSD